MKDRLPRKRWNRESVQPTGCKWLRIIQHLWTLNPFFMIETMLDIEEFWSWFLVFYGRLCFGRWSQRLGPVGLVLEGGIMNRHGLLESQKLERNWYSLGVSSEVDPGGPWLVDRLSMLGSKAASVWHRNRFRWRGRGAHVGGMSGKVQIFFGHVSCTDHLH